jgi:hypothetical protein
MTEKVERGLREAALKLIKVVDEASEFRVKGGDFLGAMDDLREAALAQEKPAATRCEDCDWHGCGAGCRCACHEQIGRVTTQSQQAAERLLQVAKDLRGMDSDSKSAQDIEVVSRQILGLVSEVEAQEKPREALDELLAKHRYDYAEVDLVAQCSCGWKYYAPVGRYNGWDWWVEHVTGGKG